VKRSANFVWLQRIADETKETGFMQGHKIPIPGQRFGDIRKHRVYFSGDRNSVNFRQGVGSRRDGKPVFCSWYA
jgi:hypothetical protein